MNYESNSHKSKEKKKVINRVATGHKKEKSLIEKMADSFIKSDADNIKDYIVSDVLIPSAKKAINDIVSNGIHMLLYGKGSSKSTNRPYTMYNKCYNGSDNEYTSSKRVIKPSNYNDVVFESSDDAKDILAALLDLIEEYGVVSVSDFYDVAGIINCYDEVDNEWGWTDLRNASIVIVPDGYKIKMPRAISIK